MSGAQGKAIEIAGGVGIIAEVEQSRIKTRFDQSWVSKVTKSPKEAFAIAKDYQKNYYRLPLHIMVISLIC